MSYEDSITSNMSWQDQGRKAEIHVNITVSIITNPVAAVIILKETT